MTPFAQWYKLIALICFWPSFTTVLYCQTIINEQIVNVIVRNGDDAPNCSPRKGVKLNNYKKKRTGWFGRLEKIIFQEQNHLKLTSSYKNDQQYIIKDPNQYIKSITFFMTNEDNNTQPINIFTGNIVSNDSLIPIQNVKACAYDQNGVLVDSTYSNRNGDFAVGFADTIDVWRVLLFLSDKYCPNPYVESSIAVPPDIDITVLEDLGDKVKINVGIDDTKMDFIRNGLAGLRTNLPTDLYQDSN